MKDKKSTKTKSDNQPKRSIGQTITSVILVIVVMFCLVVAFQLAMNGYVSFFGNSVFRVVTGSMEPTIQVGEVIMCKDVDLMSIEVGDIVCYKSEVSGIRGSIVTHRVVAVGLDGNGIYSLQTKGDANNADDPFFVQEDNFIGKVTWQSGTDGTLIKLLSFVTTQFGFLSLVVVPIFIIVGIVLHALATNLQHSLAKAKELVEEEEELDKPLPGFTTLTYRDYKELHDAILESVLKELKDRDVKQIGQAKTEYDQFVSDAERKDGK